MTRVIIAEKPSVARNIARALGIPATGAGYYEGGGDIVTWCFGHLVELAEPQAYGEQYSKWSLDSLPILPDPFKLEVRKDSSGQFKVVKRLLNDKDTTEIVCATDADREGELIFRYVMEAAGCNRKALRLWTSSQEPDAIRSAMGRLEDDSLFDGLSDAAHGRSQADWVVGMNLSRLYTCLYGTTLSCGRVQTPVVAEIVRRDKAVREFVPVPYYNVAARLDGVLTCRHREDDASRASEILAACDGAEARVTRVEQKEKREKPPLLYSLTALQKDAATLLGMSADATLSAAQSLYEKRLATYPRTDSRYITDDLVDDAERALAAVLSAGIVCIPEEYELRDATVLVDNEKVESHPALLPTASVSESVVSDLDAEEAGILSLISWQLVCALGTHQVYRATSAGFDIASHEFSARGKEVLDPGWRRADALRRKSLKNPSDIDMRAEDPDEGQELPPLEEGQILSVVSAEIEEKASRGPSYHTETSILEFMETAGREIEDDGMREVMKGRGIGTSATRANTIASVIARGYVRRDGKKLRATNKGIALVKTVIPSLCEPATTAEWEMQLAEVEAGGLTLAEFMKGIEAFVRKACSKQSPDADVAVLLSKITGNKPLGKCPKCGKTVYLKKASASCESNRYVKNPDDPDGAPLLDDGCGFTLPRTFAGKKLTEKQLAALLEKGRTSRIDGFVSKKGTTYAAVLTVDAQGKIEMVFDDSAKPAARPAAKAKASLPPRAKRGGSSGSAPRPR